MYEDSSSDEDGPQGGSLYGVLRTASRPHYKAALRAFRRAHNRASYIAHLRRRGVAVLDSQPPPRRSDSDTPQAVASAGSEAARAARQGATAAAPSELAAAEAGRGPDMSDDGNSAAAEEGLDDAEGIDGVVRLPFALASEGAVEALRWLARAVDAGTCLPLMLRAPCGYQ